MTLMDTCRDPAATEDPYPRVRCVRTHRFRDEVRGGRLEVVTASPGLSFSVDTARAEAAAGLPELLVAIHTSRQSCSKAGKRDIYASLGVIRGIPV